MRLDSEGGAAGAGRLSGGSVGRWVGGAATGAEAAWAEGASGSASGVERARTWPGTTAGPPPRRRTTVVLSTPGKVDGGICGAVGGSKSGAPDAATGRSPEADAGLETRRRTASGEGRVDVGGEGRWVARGFAEILRGRGVTGAGVGAGSSSSSSASSSARIRCSSSGPEERSRRLAWRFTRPATCMSTACVSSVSATAVGRRVTR